ncbi:hypothetical protein AL037_08290 [Salipiger aestuarii]|nr:hypothetical protein AL037_08290 [Salipiger aestuarii]
MSQERIGLIICIGAQRSRDPVGRSFHFRVLRDQDLSHQFGLLHAKRKRKNRFIAQLLPDFIYGVSAALFDKCISLLP